jgi:hypothetical protein
MHSNKKPLAMFCQNIGVNTTRLANRPRVAPQLHQEATESTLHANRHANRRLLGKAQCLLNSHRFHFTLHEKESGTFLMTQTWSDGLIYSVEFGPKREIAVAVNLDTMRAQAFVYASADYAVYKAKGLPVPLHRPFELSLTPGGHVAIAHRLEKLLNEMHVSDFEGRFEEVSQPVSEDMQRPINFFGTHCVLATINGVAIH